MKVLILFNETYPHGMATAKRLHLSAKGLLEQGIDVVIAVGKPGEGPVNELLYYDGVPYVNLDTAIRKATNPIARRLSLYLDKLNVTSYVFRNRKKFDLIWPIDCSWDVNVLIALIGKASGMKTMLEENEYPYISAGTRRFSIKYSKEINQWMTINVVYKLIDGFIVICKSLEDLVNKHKSRKAKVLKVPILIAKNGSASEEDDLKKRFEDPFIFHAGTLNEQKDGIVSVFNAFAKINKKLERPLKFVVTNKRTIPSTMKKIEKILQDNELKDAVIFHDHLSNEEVAEYMKKCTLAVINKPKNKQNQYNFSTKLGEYLQNGVPLITTNIGETRNYLKDKENVLVIEPDDIDAIVENIEFILNNPQEALQIAHKGKSLAENEFDYRIHAPRVAQFMRELTSK